MGQPGLKHFFRTTLIIILLASITLGLHLGILSYLEIPLFEQPLILTYSCSFGLSWLIIIFLSRLPSSLHQSLGFLYLGTMLVKFLFLYFLFHPDFKSDGEISRLEFTSLFVPFGVSLAAEVKLLINKYS